MLRVLCPHCWELVQTDEADAGSLPRCPACAGALDPAGREEVNHVKYEVHAEVEKAHQSREVQEYVHSLEEQARRELERQPYHRGRPPVDLVVGLILMGSGVLLLVTSFTGGGGLMSSLVNGIFPAFGLILIGVLCLIFWAK
jgi:hypothetical protein